MSRIDDLIAEHCPDGVEFKRLSEIVRIKNGKDHKTLGDGEFPVYGSGGIMRYADTYPKWSELLPDDKQLYYSRIINFTSHSTLSNEAVAQPTPAEQATVKLLLDHLKNSHGFWQQQGA